MIAQGKVAVNGKVVKELGTKVNPGVDEIRVEGEPVLLELKQKPIYVMLNKPLGVVSSVSDAHAETTVADLVAQLETRLYPVGRLDADSSGLLLLTNDGDFAYRLTHPRYHVPKIYQVRARGFVDRNAARALSEGVDLPDGRTAPAEVKFIGYDAATQCTILEMTLYEGRNRQVRRMLESVGHPVKALTRIGFGSLRLNELSPGTWRKLRPEEVEHLLGMARPTPTPKKQERRIHLPFRPRNGAASDETAADGGADGSLTPSAKPARTPRSRPDFPAAPEEPIRPARPTRDNRARGGSPAPPRPGNVSKPGGWSPNAPGYTSRPGGGSPNRTGSHTNPGSGAPHRPGSGSRPGHGTGRPNAASRPRPPSGSSNRSSGPSRPNTGPRRPEASNQRRKPKR